jgi:hypothetical protein
MKTLRTALLAAVLSILLWGPPATACEDGHWIEDVVSTEAVIVLEDGSTWLVNDSDRITTALWLAVSNIVICKSNADQHG